MNIEYVLIVLGEPFSVFSEIIGKYFSKKIKLKKKIVLIGNKKLLKEQLIKLKYNFKLNEINNLNDAKKNIINIFDINFDYDNIFSKITTKSKSYIEDSFNKALNILNKNKKKCILINGPVSKEAFLQKKYLGITEYLSSKTFSKNVVMLIFNDKLSVSPITTHIPIKNVAAQINKKRLTKNILIINDFYKNTLNRKISFAILGLNPHCETTDKISEENIIIKPAIKFLKERNINISGPFAADTFFLKKNISKYDVVIGMYHDQVLTPIKTIFEFNAINITIGLPFIRISPDHGPNSEMLGKNKSDPSSFICAMKFIEKLN